MPFTLGSARAFSDLRHVGIAIKSLNESQRHIGILYRHSEKGPRFFHLAFHYDLRDEEPSKSYYWDDCHLFDDDDINGKIVAAHVTEISKNKNLIPYGVFNEGGGFREDGSFIEFPEMGMGYTCSTFVLEVFSSFGYEFVIGNTWPSREDDEIWQANIINALESVGAGAIHISAAREYIGAARFRPEEVAAATTFHNPPMSFNDAERLAREILGLFEQ